MARIGCLSLLAIAACGRVGFDPLSGAGDGGTTDTGADAAVYPTGPFGTPTPLTTVNSNGADVDPSMTADGLQLFFCSSRGGGLDIYVATRASPEAPWGTPTPVAELNTGGIEQDTVIAADGHTLYFTRNGDIFQAQRAASTGAFAAPSAVTELNSSSTDIVSSITLDGLALTFASTRPGGQGSDIYLAQRTSTAVPWDVITRLSGPVNGAATDSDSFVVPGLKALYFDSNRGGDFDIYLAERASLSDDFGTPAPVAELNTSQADGDLWLSVDGHTALYARGPLLTLDLYEARR